MLEGPDRRLFVVPPRLAKHARQHDRGCAPRAKLTKGSGTNKKLGLTKSKDQTGLVQRVHMIRGPWLQTPCQKYALGSGSSY